VGQEKNMKPSAQLDFELIDTPEKLVQFARSIANARMIAVDLEADSMFHYREKVCRLYGRDRPSGRYGSERPGPHVCR